jgi:Holliday junction resolvase RusA-like endonuclease
MSDIIYQAVIPINPRTKKNSQQIVYQNGKPKLLQSDAYLQYEKDAGWFLKKPLRPISIAVNVRCIFYRDSERRCDLTNLLEAIDDILVKYKVLADDNFKIIAGHDGSRVYVDRKHPRTEIYIEEI